MDDARRERLRLEATIARLQRAAAGGAGALTSTAHADPDRPALDVRLGQAAQWRGWALGAGVGATLLCVLVALRRLPPSFLLMAVLLALLGARSWWRAGTRRAGAPDVPDEVPPGARDEELLRTEAALGRLTEALHHAPPAVRGFVEDAGLALGAIVRGARALARRAAALREWLDGSGRERVECEHAELRVRLEVAADPVARRILEQALAASELKRQRVHELQAHAERIAAERLRIRHAVEALHLDMERAIAAAQTPSQEGMARSLARLTDEIGAIADALESVRSLH